jgi:hypothetical protein
MAYQYSVTVRNAMIDAIESTIGASPTMELRTGAPPATCATADSGTVLATLPLPADWMGAAAAGAKALAGSWQDAAADATGTFGHFRIKQGATTHWQGTVSGPGGGGDIVMDSATVTLGQQVSMLSMALTAGGA